MLHDFVIAASAIAGWELADWLIKVQKHGIRKPDLIVRIWHKKEQDS